MMTQQRPTVQSALNAIRQNGHLLSPFTGIRITESRPKPKREVTFNADEMIVKFCDREFFKYMYLPYVVAEMVWDYSETIRDLCVYMGKDNTKKLSRAISKMRDTYQRIYRDRLPELHQKREKKSMEEILELYGKELEHEQSAFVNATDFTQMETFIRKNFPNNTQQYLDDYTMLAKSVLQAITMMEGMQLYVEICDKLLGAKGFPMNHSLMPDLVYGLKIVYREFVKGLKLKADPEILETTAHNISHILDSIKFKGHKTSTGDYVCQGVMKGKPRRRKYPWEKKQKSR